MTETQKLKPEQICKYCEEPIIEGEAFEVVPEVTFSPKGFGIRAVRLHQACFIKAVGVPRPCSHCGQVHPMGSDELEPDPPGMTRREAAEAAFRELRGHRGGHVN